MQNVERERESERERRKIGFSEKGATTADEYMETKFTYLFRFKNKTSTLIPNTINK